MKGFSEFDAICRSVEEDPTSVDNARAKIKDIDFLSFNIDEIQRVQDATWIRDEKAVDIMKCWMRRQDEILLKLRAYLVVTPTITKDQLLEFTQSVRNPSRQPDLIVTDIIRRLATAGGTRAAVNPYTEKLISAQVSS
jgi:hypothetical protein